MGLTEAEVLNRRRKYGLNQMKEEKENLILKFVSSADPAKLWADLHTRPGHSAFRPIETDSRPQ